MPATKPVPLTDIWLAETVRLREEHWGPLEDMDAVRQARLAPGPLETRVLLRASLLGRREGLAQRLQQWRHAAAIAMALLLVVGVLAGLSAALGALGDGSRTVNVIWAVGALLGLHALTFLAWLLSFAGGQAAAGGGLGRLWLWAARKLARGPDAALPAQALLSLLARAGALRWLFGTISHLIWLAALGTALLTLIVVLSTAHYRFAWSTTLLMPETFVRLTQAMGWLPARLGFPVPDAALVRISDGTQSLPAAAQAQWAMWLLGIVAVYGIVPRLAAWLASVAGLRRAIRGLQVEMALPGYAVLRDRLQPPAEWPGHEWPAPGAPEGGTHSHAVHQPRITAHHALAAGTQPVLVGLELPADIAWPPADVGAGAAAMDHFAASDASASNPIAAASGNGHRGGGNPADGRREPGRPAARNADADHTTGGNPAAGDSTGYPTAANQRVHTSTADSPAANVYVAGNLDTREQRNQLLDALAASPAPRLLIACDMRQTPDRGTLALIADLAAKAAQTRVWLTSSPNAGAALPASPDRFDNWRARLQAAGMPAAAIMRDADKPLRWLEQDHV
jgi:hypothetical protein